MHDITILDTSIPMSPQSWVIRNQKGMTKRLPPPNQHYGIVPFIIKGEPYFEIAWLSPGLGYQILARGKGTITPEAALLVIQNQHRDFAKRLNSQ
jgi:hypothetical protein